MKTKQLLLRDSYAVAVATIYGIGVRPKTFLNRKNKTCVWSRHLVEKEYSAKNQFRLGTCPVLQICHKSAVSRSELDIGAGVLV